MNIILLEATEIQENCAEFADHRAEHFVKVLRANTGDRVRVGIIDGNRGVGTILFIKKKYPFSVKLALEFEEEQLVKPCLDLVLALPRPIMLKRILSQITALGVGTLHIIGANRVEKSFWDAGILDPAEYRTHLLQGLEQAVDTRVPEVVIHRKFKPFVEDYIPSIQDEYLHLICAHPGGGKGLHDVIKANQGRILLAIGPEGGWVDYEVDKFVEQGFECCTMGERILKVDTATIAFHSRISALREAFQQ
jgi:16S rRNA (uracil1498-N3)-methyltransferase